MVCANVCGILNNRKSTNDSDSYREGELVFSIVSPGLCVFVPKGQNGNSHGILFPAIKTMRLKPTIEMCGLIFLASIR